MRLLITFIPDVLFNAISVISTILLKNKNTFLEKYVCVFPSAFIAEGLNLQPLYYCLCGFAQVCRIDYFNLAQGRINPAF